MFGNFDELQMCLDWLQGLLDAEALDANEDMDEDDNWSLFTLETRQRLARLSLGLVRGFDHAETAHRVSHGLTGAAKAKQVGFPCGSRGIR